jgi:hypothetical protein
MANRAAQITKIAIANHARDISCACMLGACRTKAALAKLKRKRSDRRDDRRLKLRFQVAEMRKQPPQSMISRSLKTVAKSFPR